MRGHGREDRRGGLRDGRRRQAAPARGASGQIRPDDRGADDAEVEARRPVRHRVRRPLDGRRLPLRRDGRAAGSVQLLRVRRQGVFGKGVPRALVHVPRVQGRDRVRRLGRRPRARRLLAPEVLSVRRARLPHVRHAAGRHRVGARSRGRQRRPALLRVVLRTLVLPPVPRLRRGRDCRARQVRGRVRPAMARGPLQMRGDGRPARRRGVLRERRPPLLQGRVLREIRRAMRGVRGHRDGRFAAGGGPSVPPGLLRLPRDWRVPRGPRVLPRRRRRDLRAGRVPPEIRGPVLPVRRAGRRRPSRARAAAAAGGLGGGRSTARRRDGSGDVPSPVPAVRRVRRRPRRRAVLRGARGRVTVLRDVLPRALRAVLRHGRAARRGGGRLRRVRPAV
mmetsp:Transcript_27038/g.83289  ORF Transcript_27038/g.83289 Transcript_27038/m.83289 type:complete len:392 (-) Transcript_27038:399-1574(-)